MEAEAALAPRTRDRIRPEGGQRRMATSPPALLMHCVCLSGQRGLTLNASDFPLIFND